jgi:hypothetical protein
VTWCEGGSGLSVGLTGDKINNVVLSKLACHDI